MILAPPRSPIEYVKANGMYKSIMSQIFTVQCFQVSTLTVLSYDFLLTMDKEVAYFWKLPISISSVAYFLNRYVGLFGAISVIWFSDISPSLRTGWAVNISDWTVMILIDYILQCRVLAMWNQQRVISMTLKFLLSLEAVLKLALLIYMNLRSRFQLKGIPEGHGLKFCNQGGNGLEVWGIMDWTIPLVYGIITLTLASYKALQYKGETSDNKLSPLVKILIEDQVIYFILVVYCCLINILQFYFQGVGNDYLANIFVCLGKPGFLSMMGSHLLINLNETYNQRDYKGSDYHGGTNLSSMEFSYGRNNNSDIHSV
ncbi:hypothetical protein PNOK_0415100 [Pyrrhoderma noxium]|uniref:DUF6533 domain-containing protein n=1 Tax=Pyrrhoderma noxium TaxID=2282107 RepID=A0A286UI46_9AGAM|nr:hypothetical protein PNOK_0415100 [Pyrrhoderma noxium]